MTSRILIVDDDPAERRHLEDILLALGYVAESVAGGEEALARLRRSEAPPVAAMILDLVMPDRDGMGVLERLGGVTASLPVIVQTAPAGVDAALSALRAGAFDFLVKPAGPERLKASLANALKLGALQNEIARMRRSQSGTLTLRDLIGRAPTMQRVLDLGERAARSALPVLIEGEAGVGKVFVARAIQGSGMRRAKPFVTVDCQSVTADEIDAVLFGRDDGPGRRRAGAFQEAQGGTVFLDGLGNLPAEAQTKLLAVLCDGEVEPAGGTRRMKVDVRLIAATDRRLVDLVSEGRFREDLFYRLTVLPIWLPPLRERREDIPELARHFLARFAAEEGKTRLAAISPDAISLLLSYDWPGNIRQLQNAVFRAVVLSSGGELTPHDFPQILAATDPASARSRIVARALEIDRPRPPAAVAETRQAGLSRGDGRVSLAAAPDSDRPSRYGMLRLLDERGEIRRFEALEEEMIRFALDHCRGRMSEVARRLGIGRSTLYRKLKDYRIGTEAALDGPGVTGGAMAAQEA